MNKGIKIAVTSLLTAVIMTSASGGLLFDNGVGSTSSFTIVASAGNIRSDTTTNTGGATDTNAAQGNLRKALISGKGGTNVDVSKKTYKLEGGGETDYIHLTGNLVTGGETAYTQYESTGYIDSAEFQKLKSSEKSQFLADMNNVATATVEQDNLVTEDTRQDWLARVQNCPGVGTQLIAALLENTKPDYARANKIYKPFSGIVGTTLGILAILMVALLGIVMALDLSYISLPLFRTFVSGPDEGGGSAGGESKPKLISWEAVNAVRTAESGGGSGGQSSGSNKNAMALYFKHRVFMLVGLGVCLLYLVSGRIWSLVAWILDLMQGLF